MLVAFNETLYDDVHQWLVENNQDTYLPESIKQYLLRFKELSEVEKEQLQEALLTIPEIPEVLQRFMPNHFHVLPVELIDMIGRHLTPKNRKELATVSKQMHSVFNQSNLHAKFLECVAYGQQDKAEELLSRVFQGQPEKIQAALLHQGKLTTYAGETFNCSAYEYAYWAMDTHMCRMLEQYMDDKTKAKMLTRINAIETNGLVFQKNNEKYCRAHFDFTPLKEAYQHYNDGHNAWLTSQNGHAMDAAWLDVGKAQRNVPAHVAQEYCHPDHSFSITPEFNEEKLPRGLTMRDGDSWFPLAASNSGLGFDFVISRDLSKAAWCVTRDESWMYMPVLVRFDHMAIIHLAQVRTKDLEQSRQNLTPLTMSQSMSV